jgi:DNA mismatch endonuclease, patch repair protein
MTDVFSKSMRSWVMSRIHGKDTRPEKQVRSLLHVRGFRFSLHRKDLPGNPDIVLPRYGTVVQVQGCFWHGHSCKEGRRPRSNRKYWNAKLDRNKRRDSLNARMLRRLGWRRIVVWECQVKKLDDVGRRLTKLIRG